MSTFDRAFALVVGVEGGHVNDPRDPGGETKYGISKRSYPAVDIANLTLDQAKAIYLADYWNKAGCDRLPDPVAVLVFDEAVNSGVSQAVRWLQQASGVAMDGVVGPMTLAAVASKPLSAILIEMSARRLVLMAGLPTWSTFGLGWARRVGTMLLASTAFEASPPAPPPDPAVTIPAIEAAFRRVLAEKAAP